MNLLAHSKNCVGVTQSFRDHTLNTVYLALKNIDGVCNYIPDENKRKICKEIVRVAASVHDFGKLDPNYEQPTYINGKKEDGNESNHVDAGVAWLLKNKHITPAFFVKAHHYVGLENIPFLISNKLNMRDCETILPNGQNQNKYVDAHMDSYVESFKKELPIFSLPSPSDTTIHEYDGFIPLYYRIILSCIKDADVTDSACHSYNETPIEDITLQYDILEKKLYNYVKELNKNKLSSTIDKNERLRYELRQQLTNCCKNIDIGNNKIMYLPAPVGSGKSFSALIALLNVAKKLKLRRIFWVLPYTSIVDQGLHDCIEAFNLLNSDSTDVIVANHSKLEFQDYNDYYLSANWKTQIIITTSSSFFETISSNNTRKLHRIVGSGVFVDEFHTLPMTQWKITYRWMKELTEQFGCFFLLGSGTFIKSWELNEFKMSENIPSVIPNDLFLKLEDLEKKRIKYDTIGEISIENFINRVCSHDGNTIIVCSTVKNAAYLANSLKQMGKNVEHLSTSLHSISRAKTIKRIKLKLHNKENFILVATSCVEAGMDFSFKHGYRERDSVESLIQTGGRVNRSFEFSDSVCYDFTFAPNDNLTKNFTLNIDRNLLSNIFNKFHTVDFTKMTEYKQMRFNMECGEIVRVNKLMMQDEQFFNFKNINENYKIVNSSTKTIIINKDLVDKILNGEKVDFKEIEKWSVNVYEPKLKKLRVLPLNKDKNESQKKKKDERIFYLVDPDNDYDDFLGYMRALI